MQLDYPMNPRIGLEGQIVDISANRDVVTALAVEEIPPGRFVTRDTKGTDKSAKLPTLPEEVTGGGAFGVSVLETAREIGKKNFARGEAVGALAEGRIYVLPEDDVTPESEVHVRIAGGALGRFRATADGSNTVQFTKARWRSVTAAEQPAVLEIDL